MHDFMRAIRNAALLLFVLPALAYADQGVTLKLSWDHCAGDGYVGDRSFACNTNTGEDWLFASVVFGAGPPAAAMTNLEGFVDFRATSGVVPSWWLVGSGGCRAGGVQLATTGLSPSPACTPWYDADGLARSPIEVSAFELGNDGPNAMRAHFAIGLLEGEAITFPTGSAEYTIARVRVTHAKSTGTGACSGCLVPTCIGFGELRLSDPTGQVQLICLGTTASTVTWQGAYVTGYLPVPQHRDGPGIVGYHGNLGCSTGPVPAQNHTWGAIKSMYH